VVTAVVVIVAVLVLAGVTTLSRRPRVVVLHMPADQGDSGGLLSFLVGLVVAVAVLVAVVLASTS
jgi:hypothetical protein